MTLLGILGKRREVNHHLIQLALKLAPATFIDADNCCNIHKYPTFPLEKLSQLKVVPAESLYRFNPTLRTIKRNNVKNNNVENNKIFISTFTRLFSYDNEQENKHLFEHSWETIATLAAKSLVIVGVEKGSIHEKYAKQSCITYVTMGHTIWSQRIVSDIMLSELEKFGRALRQDERILYNRILKQPLKHLGSISNASSLHTWAFLLLGIILEQEKKIDELHRCLQGREQHNPLVKN